MAMKVFVGLTCLAVMAVSCQAFCGVTGPIWRNNNQTCPSKAVCGDIFEHYRDWRNGTACWEKRILSNCLCANNAVCPFENHAHELNQSKIHRSFMCEPLCDIDWCSDFPTRYSMSAEQQSMDFNRKSYYKMNCRCRGHMQSTQTMPPRRWVTRARGVVEEFRRRATLYYCNDYWTTITTDQCLSQD